jgi:hypothetical protein
MVVTAKARAQRDRRGKDLFAIKSKPGSVPVRDGVARVVAVRVLKHIVQEVDVEHYIHLNLYAD